MTYPREGIDEVIDGGFCIGCGACAFARPDGFQMRFDDGMWRAQRTSRNLPDISTLCPMSGRGLDEDEIGRRHYDGLPIDESIGRHLYCGVGSVNEEDFRSKGGSGGLLTWLAWRLIQEDLVDAVLHVLPAGEVADGSPMFAYGISSGLDEVRQGAKSRYYPVEMSQVLETVRKSNKRFAVVGLPCFLKAIRLLQDGGLLQQEQTPFLVGLICGHLKSSFFAELLAWQKEVTPERLLSVDFRVKLSDRPASQYGFSVASNEARSPKIYPMAEVIGHDWGEGLLKNFACEFCDDVVAECADIAIGDAWLPRHVDDPKGTNVCVVRNPVIMSIIDRGVTTEALTMEEITAVTVAASQSSGLRHRREGLSHRLEKLSREGRWTPQKRRKPQLAATGGRRRIYDLRLQIAAESNEIFSEARRKNDLGQFIRRMAPLLKKYHKAYRPSIRARVVGRIKRLIGELTRRTGVRLPL